MVLKELILAFSTLGGCSGLKDLIVSNLRGCGGLERTDF